MTEHITVDRRHTHRRTIPAVVLMTTLVMRTTQALYAFGTISRALEKRLHGNTETRNHRNTFLNCICVLHVEKSSSLLRSHYRATAN